MLDGRVESRRKPSAQPDQWRQSGCRRRERTGAGRAEPGVRERAASDARTET